MEAMGARVAAGRGALIGVAVGALEGVIWLLADRTVVFRPLAVLLVALPLGAALAYKVRLPRWKAVALAGPVAFVSLAWALHALSPGQSLLLIPRVAHALPFVLGAVAGYAAVAWIASGGGGRRSWTAVIAVIAVAFGFVAAAHQGRAAVADLYEEWALKNLGVPLLGVDLPGYRLRQVAVWRYAAGPDTDPQLHVRYWHGTERVAIVLRAANRGGLPERRCADSTLAWMGETCRSLPGNRWLRRGEISGVILFARERNASIVVEGNSESEALTILDSLRPVTAKTLVRHMRAVDRT